MPELARQPNALPRGARSAVTTGLRLRYIAVLTFLAATTGMGLVMMSSAFRDTLDDSELINLSGRQRMLSQRLLSIVATLSLNKHSESAQSLRRKGEETLNQFREGSREVLDGVRRQSELDGFTNQHDRLVIESESLSKKLAAKASVSLKNPSVENKAARAAGINELVGLADDYVAVQDTITGLLAQSSYNTASKGIRWGQVLFLVTLFLLLLSVIVIFEPGIRALNKGVRNIEAEREAAERLAEGLRQSSMLNDAVFRSVADAILVIDDRGQILRSNPAAEKLFGPIEDGLVGQDVTHFMGAGDREKHDSYIKRFLRTGVSKIVGGTNEVQARRLDGEMFPAELSVAELEWEGQHAFAGVVRDISERKQLQQRLSQVQKLESLGELAAGIAHEINTPLQFIGANSKYLEMAAPKLAEAATSSSTQDSNHANLDKLSTTVQEAIHENLEGIRRVGDIVRAMKDFSHPGVQNRQPTDLNACVQSTVTISRNRWKHIAEIDLQLDPDLPECMAQPAELNQVLLNFIVNASDAVAEKQGDDESSLGKITIRTWSDGRSVSAAVEDTGAGIPEHVMPKIFDPFYTTKEMGKGSGQGLSISHTVIVSKHQGTLHASNLPGGGARLEFTIPCEAPESGSYEADLAQAKT